MNRSKLWLTVLLWAAPAAAQDAPRSPYRPFTATRRTFACDAPAIGWYPVEEDTPYGSAVHWLGPVEADGAFRAAIHVHFVDSRQPGFLPLDEAVKRERDGDRASGREATPVRRWRVAKRSARRFEVTETRQLPGARLPSRPLVLRHYYTLVPAGDGYFIVKLTSTQETYQEYRKDYEQMLESFRVLGY